jgi:uncharacterized protein
VTHAVDIRDLLARPGASREVHLTQRIEGLSTELAEVPDPVRVDVVLESVVEGILVSGPVRGEMSFRCARCLQPFSRGFTVQVTELFAAGEPNVDGPTSEEAYPLGEGSIDLEPMIRDAVMLSMPFSPLCREGCLGLCERCGGVRNLGECTCPPQVDPRWAALEHLDLD